MNSLCMLNPNFPTYSMLRDYENEQSRLRRNPLNYCQMPQGGFIYVSGIRTYNHSLRSHQCPCTFLHIHINGLFDTGLHSRLELRCYVYRKIICSVSFRFFISHYRIPELKWNQKTDYLILLHIFMETLLLLHSRSIS